VHFDHSGGLRTYVSEGAIIVTDAANRAYYSRPGGARTINPDALARSGKARASGTFSGKYLSRAPSGQCTPSPAAATTTLSPRLSTD
jgi:hypothetical protein